jgi:hypothetical protein
MKTVSNEALPGMATDPQQTMRSRFWPWYFGSLMLVSVVSFSGCQKQDNDKTESRSELTTAGQNETGPGPIPSYAGLSKQTQDELLQVRAATAKYHNIEHAKADQYVDIGLKMENMGYHFLKAALVSPVFDLSKPPILVYNKRENGDFELVAVEYAVPINPLAVSTPPEGFTGTADNWDFNTLNTGWWTLHAWVWKYNPSGVFHPTNPLVEVR